MLLILKQDARPKAGLSPCQHEMYDHPRDKSPEKVILQYKELDTFGKGGPEGKQTSVGQVFPTFFHFQFPFPTSGIFLNPTAPHVRKDDVHVCLSYSRVPFGLQS